MASLDFTLSLAAAMAGIVSAPGAGRTQSQATQDSLPDVVVKSDKALDWSMYADTDTLVRSVMQRLPIMTVEGEDYVVIDARAADGHSGADLLDSLTEEFGLISGAHYGAAASGLLPLDHLPDLDMVNGLDFAAASARTANVGSTTSQDVTALSADIASTTFNVDGTGVSVGILSDSFDASTTASTSYADDIASGDLPNNVTVIADLPTGNSIDEGRAMAQLVHDIAPGADLLFATAFTGAAGFAANIDALVNAGADIIVDDIIYLFEPMFQDGIIAQAAANAVDAGVAFFSSAGNNGSAGYEAPFRATNDATLASIVPFGAGTTFHDWDPGPGVDTTLDITIPVGSSADLFLQWTDPFSSLFGSTAPTGSSPGAQSDLDFHILDQSGAVLFSSLNINVGRDPSERVMVDNFTGAPINAQLVINNFEGPDPEMMRIVGFDVPNDDFITGYNLENRASFSNLSEFRAGTTYGHAVAEGVLGVGAAPFFYTEAFGAVDGTVPETFSALGGSTIYFDTDGNRLATPDVRDAVDFTASDGGNTTFFGSDISLTSSLFPGGNPDLDSFPNFFGTSAAAPNAAAVAALMLEANPNLTPADIERILEQTAVDIDTPFTLTRAGASFTSTFQELASVGVGTGNDARTGAGLINAADAVAQALAELPASDPPLNTPPVAANDSATTDEDTAVIVDVLANDTDTDLDTLTVASVTQGNDGTVTIRPDGRVTYTPRVNFNGSDSFSYTLTDGQGGSATATVSVTVDAVNDNPNAANDAAETEEGEAVTIAVLGNDTDVDGDALTIAVFTQGSNGAVSAGSGGALIYTPSGNFTGTDSFTYTVTDGQGGSDSATVQVTVNPVDAGEPGGTIGTTGNDSLIGTAGPDTISGLDGNDTIDGLAGRDSLSGGANADSLLGGDGLDVLDGGGGADILDGGKNDDTLLGGNGNDTIRVSAGIGDDSVDGGSGTDVLEATRNGLNIGLKALTSVEVITAAGFSDVRITGSASGDNLDFSGVTIQGITSINTGGGQDTLIGSSAGDVLLGGGGPDSLDGGGGADSLTGGGGDDTVLGGQGNDVLLYSGPSNGLDSVDGGGGFDTIQATANGTVIGLKDLSGVETITGNGFANVAIQGGGGPQLFDFSGVTLTDIAFIDGRSGQDTLIGSSGNDDLRGDAGADSLSGGAGNDTLTGGSGADVFVVANGADTDVLVDFERGRDSLDLTGISDIADFADLDTSGNGVVDASDALAGTFSGSLALTFSDAVIRLTDVTELAEEDLML